MGMKEWRRTEGKEGGRVALTGQVWPVHEHKADVIVGRSAGVSRCEALGRCAQMRQLPTPARWLAGPR